MVVVVVDGVVVVMLCCVVLCCVIRPAWMNSRGGVCPRRFFTHCGVILCVFTHLSFHKFARPIFQGRVDGGMELVPVIPLPRIDQQHSGNTHS